MEIPATFKFRPTDEDIVDSYLRFKNDPTIEEVYVSPFISNVNICSYDPWDIPFASESKWNDEFVWYFFSREDYKRNQRWETESGYWEETGLITPIIVGNNDTETNGIQIGEKKFLIFQCNDKPTGYGSKHDYIMNEYHATFLPPDQRKYVICKVEFLEHGYNSYKNTASSDVEPTQT